MYFCRVLYKNGYLTKIKCKNQYDEISEQEYSWSNGNIIQPNFIEYDSRENLLNLNFYDNIVPDGFIKFKGCSTKNHWVKTMIGTDVETFNYTFDTDGYPTQLVMSLWIDGQFEITIKHILTYY